MRVQASDCLKHPFIWSFVHPPRFRTHKSGRTPLPPLTNHPINFEGLRKGTHLRIQVPSTTGPIQHGRLERSHDAHREPRRLIPEIPVAGELLDDELLVPITSRQSKILTNHSTERVTDPCI